MRRCISAGFLRRRALTRALYLDLDDLTASPIEEPATAASVSRSRWFRRSPR